MPSQSRRRAAALLAALAIFFPGALPAAAAPARAADVAPPTADAGPLARGVWKVEEAPGGGWRVSWTAPSRLPITSDRPRIVGPAGQLGAPTLGADGRTVSVLVRSATRPDPTRLDVILSGDRLDVAGRDGLGATTTAVSGAGGSLLSVDPATPGAFAVASSDYQLAPVKMAGMPQPIEMVGHVVEPTADAVTGPRPLVLFLHGRHDFCYNPDGVLVGFEWPCAAPDLEVPSQLGYDYIQQVLASQGYTTVSIRANGINAQDWALADGGADARAKLVEAHLDHWATLAAGHQVDLSRVILVGHSRGGEGVDRAALQIPLSAPYRIAGQVLLAPTDFGTQVAAYVPTVTILPYCDGDVSDLQGQRFTDSARDLTADDTALRSSVLVMGANHNFFNTEWTPGVAAAPSMDDWWGAEDGPCGSATPARLTAAEQRAVGVAYVAGAAHLFAAGEVDLLPIYDGSRARVASAGRAVVLSHAIGGGREIRRPDTDAGLTLATARTQFCDGVYGYQGPHATCGRDVQGWSQTPHWPGAGQAFPVARVFEMAWNRIGQTGGLLLDTPLDLSGGKRLELRTIVDPIFARVKLTVRLTDADGATADFTPLGGSDLAGLPNGMDLSKHWAQSVLIDPAGAGIDLARVVAIDLIGGNVRGRVWVLDVAAASGGLVAVPARRLPLVSLGNVTVREGDDSRSSTARLPFTVRGTVTRRSRFVVQVTPIDPRRSPEVITVDLAPGQTSGVIPVDYTGNTDPDPEMSRGFLVAAWGARGVMTDEYMGFVNVKDDDPMPGVRVTVPSKPVIEGKTAVWTVRLSRSLRYDLNVSVDVLRGPTSVPALNGADVSSNWLAQVSPFPVSRTTPLWQRSMFIYTFVPAGSTSVTIRVPIVKDGKREPKEQLTFRFTVGTTTVTKTIYVAASK